MSCKLNGIPHVETAEVGEPDIAALSDSVSRACDKWLAARGLRIERGRWGPRGEGERVHGKTKVLTKPGDPSP